MAFKFLQTLFTPAVRKAQAHYYGAKSMAIAAPEQDELTPMEIDFIAARDSFYMATITENGWPYIQHRGGPKGFLMLLGPNRLGFADFKGNRQLLTTGNLSTKDRVCLFLMDYPNRERLKLLGHAQVLDARDHAAMADQLTPAPELKGLVERLFLIDVLGFDWNCPKCITPRYTLEELQELQSKGS